MHKNTLANEDDHSRLAEIMDRISDGFVALDNNWYYTYMNKSAGEMVGRIPEELVGKNMWEEFPFLREVPLDLFNAYMQATKEQKTISIEKYYKPLDKWFDTCIYPSPHGISIYFRDITKRKKSETEIREVQSKMDAAIRIGKIGYWDWDIVNDKVFWNDRMYEIYNVAKNTALDYDTVVSRVHPDDIKFHNELVKERISSKDNSPWEYRVLWPDGSIRYVLVQMEVLDNEKGEAFKLQGTVIDITESKKAELDLAETENRFRTILNTEPECVKILNELGEVIEMNPAGLAMIEAESLDIVKGNSVLGIINTPYRKDFAALTRKIFNGESGNLEFEITGLKGTRRWLETHAVPLKNPGGEIVSLLGVTRDITKRKKAEQLLEGEKLVLEMIAKEKPMEEILNIIALNYEAISHGALCSILLVNEAGTHVQHAAGPSLPDKYNKGIDGEPIGPVAGSCGTAIFKKERVIVTDIATDPLWVQYRDFALGFGLKAAWSTPIINANGNVYGSFAIYYKEIRNPSEEDLKQIERFANQVEIVLQRYGKDAQIKKSEEKYRSVIERVSDAFVALDKNWNYTYVNKKAGELFGRDPESLVGKHIWTEFPEGVGQPFYDIYHTAMETQTPQFLEEYYSPWDRYFENHIYPSSEGLTIFFRDITENNKAALEIAKSQDQLKFISDNIPFYIAQLDADRKYLFVNKSYAELFNLTPGDIVGKHASEVLGEKAYTYVASYMETVLAGKSTGYEFVLPDSTNNVKLLYVNYIPQFDSKGIVSGFIAAVSDITNRKKIEIKLKEQEHQLRLFIENSPAALVMLDKEMKYMEVSNRWIKDYKLDKREITGKSHYELFPEISDEWKAIHQKCLAGATIKKEEDLFIRADGSEEWIRWEIHPWKEANGDVGGIIIFSESITDRKIAEQKIASLNKDLEQRVKERTAELEEANKDLAEVNDLFVGNEIRIMELKEELELLKQKASV